MAALMRKFRLFLILVVLLVICQSGSADRVNKKIYIEFKGIGACFRRFNATHQTGCASSRSGNVGVVHLVQSQSDLDWIVNNGTHQPYVAVISTRLFDRRLVEALVGSGKVNGMIVIDRNETLLPKTFSADLSCPNDKYGMYQDHPEYADCKSVKWNEGGNGLLYDDFNLPIYSMTNTSEIDVLINVCYKQFNEPVDGIQRDYPLCAAEVKDVMDGAKDSITCIRRSNHITNFNPAGKPNDIPYLSDKYCDPLGDRNVYSTYKLVNKTQARPEKSVIVAAARLDATSMFANAYPGADTAVAGFVALLGAAQALSVHKDAIMASPNDVMFAFFQGEAYDYIGSSRMAYEMEQRRFPQSLPKDWDGVAELNTTHIKYFIELSQVGLDEAFSLWTHTDPVSMRNHEISVEVTKLRTVLKKEAQNAGLSLTSADAALPLPPASLQSFLRRRNISGLVIADHHKTYSNRYYNSRYDTAKTIDADYPPDTEDKENYVTDQAKKLTKVSETLAKTLYKLTTGEDTTQIKANEQFVTNLLYCYLHSPRCKLFRTVVDTVNSDALEKARAPYPLYVGVDYVKNVVTKLTLHVLAFLTGDIKKDATKETCKAPDRNHTYTYIWMQGPKNETGQRNPMCVISLANYSDAISPAFVIDDYDMLSGEYSTWTESIWPEDAMSVRIFLMPSQAHQTAILSAGVIVFLLLTLLIYFITRCPQTLFNSTTQEFL